MPDRICAALSLGAPTAPPVPLQGGYTHRMLRLDTAAGRYAVKLLNPEIMARSTALENYRAAEAFETLLEAAGLPILPAKRINGRKLHCVDGQYLYVFDYYEGRVLREAEITPGHCARMGEVLARIHGLKPCLHPERKEMAPMGAAFWNGLAEALTSCGDAGAEGEALRAAAPMLAQVFAALEAANRALPPVLALCHNDMDAKNVLWRGDDFRIIDLECLGYADPRQELLDLAVSWAGWPAEEGRFKAFVQGYLEAGGVPVEDAALVYDSRRNHLDWLAYNAQRALFDAPEERSIGREQIRETIGKIESDQRIRATILQWLG